MDPHYSHTQRGWVMIAAVVPGLLLALLLLPGTHAPAGVAVALALVALVGAAFSSLTVTVDAREIEVRFAGGLLRRRIALHEVREQRRVRNPWFYGWGIHRYPGGWLWNVGGYDAVELLLADGSGLRIGTDEPEALARAIAQAAPQANADGGTASRPRRTSTAALVVGLGVLAGVGLLALLFSRQMRDPVVTISGDTLTVETPFYGESFQLAALETLALEERLPAIEMRTNGFSAAGILRGWFRVRDLGSCKLFVDAAQPPFLLLRQSGEPACALLNFGDPARTRALREELAAARAAARP